MNSKLLAAGLAVMMAASAPDARAEETAGNGSGRHHAGPWVVITAGGITAAVGILSFVGAVKANADAATEAQASGCTTSPSVVCPAGYDPSHLKWLVDGEHAMNWIGAIFTAAGGAAVIGGLVWHFLEPTRTLSIRPAVGPSSASISLTARF